MSQSTRRSRFALALTVMTFMLAGLPGRGRGHAPRHEGEHEARAREPWHRALIQIRRALRRQPSAAPMVLAILDTGLTTDDDGVPLAPGLEDLIVLPGADLIEGDDTPYDDNGHGTLMAGIVASTGRYLGVAPGVAILPIKVLDATRSGSDEVLAAGIRTATAAGADLISMSLAFPPGYVPSGELAGAIAEAAAAGVVLIAAAGNDGGEVAYPAAFGEVIAVGGARLVRPPRRFPSARRTVRRADYSGFGAALDLLAPGGTLDLDLDLDGYPDGIPAVGFDPTDPDQRPQTFWVAGTSAATAQIAGISALLMAAGADQSEVRALLQAGASHLPPRGFDLASGAGLVDAARSLRLLRRDRVPHPPRRLVNPVLGLYETPSGDRVGVAAVEVVDADLRGVPGALVLGRFRVGAAGAPALAFSEEVAGRTDSHGIALLISRPVRGATLFELGVDRLLERPPCAEGERHGEGEHRRPCRRGRSRRRDRPETAAVPRGFARFELGTLRALASLNARGAGFEPSPFLPAPGVRRVPDVIALRIDPAELQRALRRAAGPSAARRLAGMIPLPSVFVRSFGAAGSSAPVVAVIEQRALDASCALSSALVLLPSSGAGFEPSPFRLGESIAPLAGDRQIIVEQSVTGPRLRAGGPLTRLADLGAGGGTPGVITVGQVSASCPASILPVSDIEAFSAPIQRFERAQSLGLFVQRAPEAARPTPADQPVGLGPPTLLGMGFAGTAFATAEIAVASAADGLWPAPGR